MDRPTPVLDKGTYPYEQVDVEYVGSEDAFARIDVAGAIRRREGKYVELIPRISRQDYKEWESTQKPTVSGYAEPVLNRIPNMTDAVVDKFMSCRRVVETEHEGARRACIVYDLPRPVDDVDLTGDWLKKDQSADVGGRRERKRYTLMQLMTDVSLQQKFAISARVMETVKRMTVTRPAEAAKLIQDAIETARPDLSVKVVAGEYSMSKVNAKRAIQMLSRPVTSPHLSIQADVVDGVMLLYGPGGQNDWHVRGPLDAAYEIHDVHKLVTHLGTFDPMFLLGLETQILGIEVFNGETYEPSWVEMQVASPSSASLPDVSSAATLSLLSVEQRIRLDRLTDRVLTVTDGEQKPVASAVQVSGRHVLINSHVVSSADALLVDGRPVRLIKQLSRDIWVARNQMDTSPWVLRRPDVGETAVLCYRVGDSVRYSAPVEIVACDGDVIRTTRIVDMIPGMSGAALVALRDSALFGVHCAVTLSAGLSYHFGDEQFGDLLEADQVSQVSRSSASGEQADNVYAAFKRRGLGPVVKAAISSLAPVYMAGKHVGMLTNVGDAYYTTCDADLPIRLGAERLAHVFASVPGRRQFRCEPALTGLSFPTLTRRPTYYEKVIVVGTDNEGPYFSLEVRVVHIGVDSRSFVIEDLQDGDLPLTGGLVVAVGDAAVLGQFGHRTVSAAVVGGVMCYPLAVHPPSVPEDSAAEYLQRRFPFLNISGWSDHLLDEVFVHASVGSYKASDKMFNAGPRPLANIGDSEAKAVLYVVLRERNVPHSQWTSVMQERQTNDVYARMAWDFGYARYLRAGVGVTFPQSSRAYADLTEALIGAVAIVETREVLAKLCHALGAIPELPAFAA